ncbi:hypothetical protein HDV00_007981, partial [Rhizophlyctis rosea]
MNALRPANIHMKPADYSYFIWTNLHRGSDVTLDQRGNKILNVINDWASSGQCDPPDVTTFAIFLFWALKNGRQADVEWVYSAMDRYNVLQTGDDYAKVLRVHMRMRDGLGALELYERMVRDGIDATVEGYEYIITALVRDRRSLAAEQILQEMIERGLRPTIRIVATMLTFKVCHPDGRQWFQEMLDTYSLSADIVCLHIFLLHAIRTSENHDALEALMRRILDDKKMTPDFLIYDAVIRYYAVVRGDLDKAMEMMDEMRSRGIEPQAATFGDLLGGYWTKGDERGAEMCLELMDMYDLRPDRFMFSRLAEAYRKVGDLEGMAKVFEMSSQQRWGMSMKDILQISRSGEREERDLEHEGQGFTSYYEGQDSTFDDHLPPFTHPPFQKPTRSTPTRFDAALINQLLTLLRLRNATPSNIYKLYTTLPPKTRSTLHNAAYANLLHILLDTPDEFETVWKDMAQAQVVPNAACYSAMIQYVSRSLWMSFEEKRGRCLGVLEEMKRIGVRRTRIVYAQLMILMMRGMDVEGCQGVLEMMRGEGVVPGLQEWEVMVKCWVRAGVLYRAEEGVKWMVGEFGGRVGVEVVGMVFWGLVRSNRGRRAV